MKSVPTVPLRVVMFPGKHDLVQLYTKKLRAEGVEVAAIPPFHYASPWAATKLLVARIRGYRLIHLHWPFFYPAFLAPLFRWYIRILGYDLVWEMHNIEPHKGSIEIAGKERERLYAQARFVIFHSEKNELDARHVLGVPQDSAIIPHPLFERTNSKNPPAVTKRTLGIPEGAPVFVSFGYIREYKGYDTLLAAIEELRGDAVFVIAGKPHDQPLVARIEAAARRDVRIRLLPRFLTPEEIADLFRIADYCIQPHSEITTSGAIMMALSHEKPIICSSAGGVSDVVIDGRTGLVFTAGDARALSERIRQCIDGRFTFDLQALLAQRERFLPEAVAHSFVKVYRKLADRRRPPA